MDSLITLCIFSDCVGCGAREEHRHIPASSACSVREASLEARAKYSSQQKDFLIGLEPGLVTSQSEASIQVTHVICLDQSEAIMDI